MTDHYFSKRATRTNTEVAIRGILFLGSVFALLGNVAFAASSPEQRCQGGKGEMAAKYSLCRAKADKKLAISGVVANHTAALTKCDTKLATAWKRLEDRALSAGASCPTSGDLSEIQGFMSACSDAIATAAGGGTLPADVATCNSELGTCDGNLASCESDVTVAELCGNGVIDAGEDCDQSNLGGGTCASEGFAGGSLSCGNGCVYDVSGCNAARYVDNADGSITDTITGFMWEKKVALDGDSNLGNLQDADNFYPWSGVCAVGGALCQPDAIAEALCEAGTEGEKFGCAQCASGTCNVGSPGTTAWQWLNSLNDAAYAGYGDWRIPTRYELNGILDAIDTTPPMIHAAFEGASCGACTDTTSAACACTKPADYWSSSATWAGDPSSVGTVRFDNGLASMVNKNRVGDVYVRAVRGGYSMRFVDNRDGTITDNHTGLVWEKKLALDGGANLGNLQDADNGYRWSGTCSIGGALCQPDAAAEAACLQGTEGNPLGCSQCTSGSCDVGSPGVTIWQWLGSLNTAVYGGHSDWRIPTRFELDGIVDFTDVTPPSINAAFHAASCGAGCTDLTRATCSCTKVGSYASSTTRAAHPPYYWGVWFGAGAIEDHDKVDPNFVRAVRGGA